MAPLKQEYPLYQGSFELCPDDICSICLSNQTEIAKALITNCNHVFCSECIVRHISNNKTCPYCRKPIDSLHLFPLSIEECIRFLFSEINEDSQEHVVLSLEDNVFREGMVPYHTLEFAQVLVYNNITRSVVFLNEYVCELYLGDKIVVGCCERSFTVLGYARYFPTSRADINSACTCGRIFSTFFFIEKMPIGAHVYNVNEYDLFYDD